MSYRYLRRTSDYPYFHVFNRGLDKMTIFKSQYDYQRFIDRMMEYINESEAEIVCYCLMRNHFHFILKENVQGDIAQFIQRLCTSYAMYFNLKYKHSGYVFQGPYKEKTIDSDSYLVEASAYIHNNPYEIGYKSDNYKWSSYKDYLSGLESFLIKDIVIGYFDETNKIAEYKEFVDNHRVQGQALNLEARPGLEKVMVK